MKVSHFALASLILKLASLILVFCTYPCWRPLHPFTHWLLLPRLVYSTAHSMTQHNHLHLIHLFRPRHHFTVSICRPQIPLTAPLLDCSMTHLVTQHNHLDFTHLFGPCHSFTSNTCCPQTNDHLTQSQTQFHSYLFDIIPPTMYISMGILVRFFRVCTYLLPNLLCLVTENMENHLYRNIT